jgi:hypothetical protein
MFQEQTFRCKRLIALIAPKTAQVFGHVLSERILVRQNLVADAAGSATQMNLIVGVAAWSMLVRLVA